MAISSKYWDFTMNVLTRLKEICESLDKHKGHDFYGKLRGSLQSIHESLVISQTARTANSRNIKNILRQLNELCRISHPPSEIQRHNPQLSKVAIPEREFPALDFQKRKNRVHARESIHKYFQETGPERRQQFLDKLNDFVSPSGGPLADDPNDHARSLYTSLENYGECGDTRIAFRLRLGIGFSGTASVPDFQVLLATHPHTPNNNQCYDWQVTEISMSPIEKDEAARFNVVSLENSDSLCSSILHESNKEDRLPIRLHISDAGLGWNAIPPLQDQKIWDTETRSVTLKAEVENSKCLPDRTHREHLTFLIARAFWQLYGTGWTKSPWHLESFEILHELRGSEAGFFLDEPFITTYFEDWPNFQPSGIPVQEPRDMLQMIRCLGVTFLEIILWKSVESFGDGLPDRLNPVYRQQLRVAKALRLSQDRAIMQGVSERVSNTIQLCLNSNTRAELNVYSQHTGLRGAILRSIVEPLRKSISPYIQAEHGVLLKPTWKLEPKSSSAIHQPDTSSITNQELMPPAEHALIQRVNGSTSKRSPSQEWFNDMDNITYHLCQKRLPPVSSPQNQSPGRSWHGGPIRIALLDTGSDGLVPPQCFKDFVDRENTVPRDSSSTKHGTNNVRLIRKIFKFVELYVGRIFNTGLIEEEDSKATRATIGEAITWADKTCHADIICLPFGLSGGPSQEFDCMRQAIREASNHNVCIFAAASNYGNKFGVMFPASQFRHVFAVFAADAQMAVVGEADKLNPDPQKNGKNFAFLGVEIDVLDVLNPQKALHGTSYATALLSAFAGALLHFSRERAREAPGMGITKLHGMDGMEVVLEQLAARSDGRGYRCVNPRALLQGVENEAQSCPERTWRDFIAVKISAILDSQLVH